MQLSRAVYQHDSTGVPLNIIECYLTNWRLRWLSGSPLCGIELCADVEAIEEGRKVWQISLHSHDLTSHNKCEGPEVMTHSRLGCFCLLYYVVAMGLSKPTQLLWACPSSGICYKHRQNVLALECFTFPAAFCLLLDCFTHLVGFSLDLMAMYTQRTRKYRWFPVQENSGCFLIVCLVRRPVIAMCNMASKKAKILKILKQIQNKSM